ncbi:hypothetical protein P7K49_008046, partial [Saguinus oedipus]
MAGHGLAALTQRLKGNNLASRSLAGVGGCMSLCSVYVAAAGNGGGPSKAPQPDAGQSRRKDPAASRQQPERRSLAGRGRAGAGPPRQAWNLLERPQCRHRRSAFRRVPSLNADLPTVANPPPFLCAWESWVPNSNSFYRDAKCVGQILGRKL